MSATLDPYQGIGFLYFRTNDMSNYGGFGLHMNGYKLSLGAGVGFSGVHLDRINGNNVGPGLEYVNGAGVVNGANHVEVLAVGSHIQAWLNGGSTPVIDVVDAAPVLSGGVGIEGVWSNQSRFDDIVVTNATAVPMPASWAMGLGLMGLLGAKALRRKLASARS